MLDGIFVKTYPSQPIDRGEILRYAGCRFETEEIGRALDACLQACEGVLSNRVCYCVWTVERFFEVFGRESKTAVSRLDGCQYVALFAATVGIEIDRLVAKYISVEPSKGVLLQAIGAERIESLCDSVCDEFTKGAKAKGYTARTRFSAGYGDLPLEIQRTVCNVLDCARKIGVTLTDSLLMAPTKSVTAFVGFSKE